MSEEEKEYIIWPEYLDANLSRELGRRVPKEIAVERIKLDEVINACNKLDVVCEVVKGKRYPRIWFYSYGWYVLAKTSKYKSKLKLIKDLAKAIKEQRSSEHT